MKTIAILNQSTVVPQDKAALMVQACNAQLAQHAATAWERLPVAVTLYAKPQDVPTDAYVIVLLDDADQAGALGYHDESNDQPDGKVFADTTMQGNPAGGLLGQGGVASVLSHEVLELFFDLDCNLWADDQNGKSWAVEVADPVESGSYPVTVTAPDNSQAEVYVSDFVYPAWFDPEATQAVFDQMGLVTGPFTLAQGGYAIQRTTPGDEQPVWGRSYPDWKKDTKTSSPLSRPMQRGLKKAA